jgi:hypothetical protein
MDYTIDLDNKKNSETLSMGRAKDKLVSLGRATASNFPMQHVDNVVIYTVLVTLKSNILLLL